MTEITIPNLPPGSYQLVTRKVIREALNFSIPSGQSQIAWIAPEGGRSVRLDVSATTPLSPDESIEVLFLSKDGQKRRHPHIGHNIYRNNTDLIFTKLVILRSTETTIRIETSSGRTGQADVPEKADQVPNVMVVLE